MCRIFSFLVLLLPMISGSVARAQDAPPPAIVIIGIGTAHPSGVSTLFSNIPTIEMTFAPIDIRSIDMDRSRPPFVVRREYCNPLALQRQSCPASDRQTQYSAFEVPAGVYALISITVSDSDLIRGDTATSEFFYPPEHLVFRNTLPAAMEDRAVPKLLLAPGGAYYVGNFIIGYDGRPPGIVRIERDDQAAADVVRTEGGIDLPITFHETSIVFFRKNSGS